MTTPSKITPIPTSAPQTGLIFTPDNTSINRPISSSIQVEDRNIGRDNAKFGYDQFVDFKDYNSIYQNIEDVADMNQSAGNKLGRAVYKGAGIAAATFADGTAGFIAGVINAAYQGVKAGSINSLYSDFVDNPLSQDLTVDWQNNLEDNNRLFVSADEATKDWYQRLGSANFWGDNVIKNAGFAVGALAAGYLTAGIGAEVSGLNNLMKESKVLNSLSKIASATGEEANAYKYLLNPEKLRGLASEDVIKEITDAGKAIRIKSGVNQVMSNAFSTIAEARNEALQNGNDFYNAQYSSLVKQYGGEDNIPQEERDRLAELTTNYKNATFTMNLPVLFTANAIEFKNVFSSGLKPNKNILNNFIKETGEIVRPLKYAPSTAEKIFATGKAVLKNPLSEATEEQLQYTISEGNKTYYDRVNDTEAKKSVQGWIASMATGLQKAYGTAEGWENGVIGALFGATGMPSVKTITTKGGSKFLVPTIAGGIKDDISTLNKQQRDTKALVDFANEHATDSKFRTLFDYAVVDGSLQQDKQKHLDNNDDMQYKNVNKEQLINMVEAYSELGKMEDFHQKLEDEKNLSADEIRLKYSVQQDTGKKDADGKAIITNLDIFKDMSDDELTKYIADKAKNTKEEADKIVKTKKSVQDRFPNLPENQQRDLTRLAVMQDDTTSRIEKLGEEIKQATVQAKFKDLTTDPNDIHTEETPDWSGFTTATDWKDLITHKGVYNKFLNDINDFVNENPTEHEIADKAKDLVRLVKQKEDFKKEYVKAFTPTYQIDKEKYNDDLTTKLIDEQKIKATGTQEDRSFYENTVHTDDKEGFNGGIVEILEDNGNVKQYSFKEGDVNHLYEVGNPTNKITNQFAREQLAKNDGKSNHITGFQQVVQKRNAREGLKLKARIKSLEALIKEKNAAKETFENSVLSKINEEINSLTKQVNELNELINKRDSNKRNKQEKTQKIMEQGIALLEKIDALKAERQEIKQSIQEDLSYLQDDINSLQKELDSLIAQKQKIKDDFNNSKQLVFNFVEKLKEEHEKKDAKLQEQIDKLEDELKGTKAFEEFSNANIEVLNNQIDGLQSIINATKNMLKKVTDSLDKSLKDLSLDELWNYLVDKNSPVTAEVKQQLTEFFDALFINDSELPNLEQELKELEDTKDRIFKQEKLNHLKLQQLTSNRLLEAQIDRYENYLRAEEKAFLNKIASHKIETNENQIETPYIEIPTEGKKKNIGHVFSSTTGNDGNNVNEVNPDKSKNAFFRWIENIGFRNSKDKKSYKLMTVTSTDTKYGIGTEGDIFKDLNGVHDKENIRTILVDSDGNVQKYGGEIVYSSIPTESTTWQNGEERFSFKAGISEEDKKILTAQEIAKHKAFRDKIKANPNTNYFIDVTEVHRGTNTNKNTLYNVIGSLLKKPSDATIFVTTGNNGKVSVDGRDIDYPAGIPIISFGKTFVPLYTRKLNTNEVDTTLKLFKQLIENYSKTPNTKSEEAQKNNYKTANTYLETSNGTKTIRLSTAIKNLIYLSEKSAYPVWFTLSGNQMILHVGEQVFAPETVLSGTVDSYLKEFLSNKKVQINKDYLKADTPHYETTLIGDKLVSVTHANYKSYLLGGKIDAEGNSTAILTTKVAPEVEATEEERLEGKGRRFQGGYLVFNNDPNKLTTKLVSEIKIVEEKSATTTAPIIKERTFTFDVQGKTVTLTFNKDGKLSFKGSDADTTLEEHYQEVLNNEGQQGVIDSLNKYNILTETTQGSIPVMQKEDSGLQMPEPTIIRNPITGEEIKQEEEKPERIIEEESPFTTTTETVETTDEEDGVPNENVDELNRLQNVTENSINLNKELKWLETVLPKAQYQKVRGLIARGVVGRVIKNGTILISDLASEGTVYHEAWHYVSQFLLDKKELNSLYQDWRNRNSKPDATNKEVEEALAEEFRNYMLGEKPKSTKQKGWFDKIIDVIKNLLGFVENTNSDTLNRINGLYAKIANGEFAEQEKLYEELDYNFLNSEAKWYQSHDIMEAIHVYFIDAVKVNAKDLYTTDFKGEKSKLIYQQIYSKLQSKLDAILTGAGKTSLKPLIQKFIKDGTSLSQSELNSLNKELLGLSAKYKLADSAIPYLVSMLNKNNFDAVIQEYKNFVTQFDLDITDSIEDLEIDEDKSYEELQEELLKEEQTRSGSEAKYEDSNLKSPKEGINKVIKLLVSGLVSYNKNGKYVTNGRTGIKKLVNYNETINALQTYLADSIDYQDMFDRLKNSSNVTYKNLAEYLGDRSKINDIYTMRLQNAFYNQFQKVNENYYQMLINKNNEYVFDDGNYQKLTRKIKDEWKQALVTSSMIDKREGRFIVKKQLLDLKTDSKEEKITFLASIFGLKTMFTDYNKLNMDGIDWLIKDIKSNPDITDIFSFDSNEKGRWKNLIADEASLRDDTTDNQHYTPSGKTAYNITNNNFITNLLNKFKKGIIPKFIVNDVYAADSILVERIKEGKRIKKAVLEGLKVANAQGENVETSKASLGDYIVNFVTATLDGKFPLLITGDKKTNNAYETELFIPVNKDTHTDAVISQLVDQLYKYFQTELKMSVRKNQEDTYINGEEKLRKRVLFNEHVVGKNLSDEASVKENITNFVKETVKANIETFRENNLITNNTNYFEKKQLIKILGKSVSLNEDDITKFVTAFTANNMISSIEQTKIFFGNPVYYKDVVDMFKRFSGFTARTTPLANDSALNSKMDVLMPREDGNKRDGNINIIVYDDVKNVVSALKGMKGYEGFEETDSFSFILEDDYRDIHIKSDLWTDDMEAEHQAQLKGETTNYPLNPVKPVIAGTQSNNSLTPFYGKTASMRLSKYLVDQINSPILSSLYNEMKTKNVGMALFASGNKVGTTLNTDTKTGQPFYNENGSIAKIDSDLVVKLNLDNMGIQVENKPENTKTKSLTAGTQEPAIIMSDLATNGTFGDIEVKRNGEWKTINSKEIIDEIHEVKNEITKELTNQLEDELGLTKTTKGYTFAKGAEELKNKVLEQAIRRGSNQNLISSIKLAFETSNIMLDGVVDRNKIQNILASIVENSVFKQKRFGKSLVQFPDTGMELEARQKEAENFVQGRLKTYGLDKDENRTQVFLPAILKNIYGNKTITIEDLKHDPRLLNFLGFRIPTTRLNSIEAVEIAGFLPESVGNLVVTASGITVKVGSDYDFDKLNLYFPNFTTNKEGKVTYVEYNEENKNNPKLKLKALENRLLELNLDIVGSPTNREALVTPESIDSIKAIAKTLGWVEKAQHPYNFIMQFSKIADIQNKFWTGKDLVGIFALHNKNHIMSQLAGLKLKKEYTTSDDEIIDTILNFKGIKRNEDGSYDLGNVFTIDENGNFTKDKISVNLGMLLSTMVDVTKNPELLPALNLNKETAPVVALLVRAGVPMETIFKFITQPIVKQYIAEIANVNSKFYTFDKNIREDSKSAIASRLIGKDIPYGIPLDLKMLDAKLDGIQKQVLTDFVRYYKIGQTLSAFQSAMAFDTASFKNISEIKQQIREYDDVIKTNAFENVDKYENTFLLGFKDSFLKAREYFKSVFYAEKNEVVEKTATDLKNFFTDNMFNKVAIAKVHAIIDSNIITSLLTTTEKNNKRIIDEFKYLFEGNTSVPNRVKTFLETYRTESLRKEMLALIDNLGKGKDNLRMYNRKMTSWQEQELTNDFSLMAKYDENLLKDLVKFALIQNGLTKNNTSFLHLIPAYVYNPLVKELLTINSNSSKSFNSVQFIDDFYKNNIANRDIVPYATRSSLAQANALAKGSFVLNEKNTKAKYDYLKIKKGEDFVLFKGVSDDKGNKTYTVTDKRGNGIYANEFGLSKSNYSDNNNLSLVKETKSSQWNEYKDKILIKHPAATEAEWNKMSEVDKKQLIKCL